MPITLEASQAYIDKRYQYRLHGKPWQACSFSERAVRIVESTKTLGLHLAIATAVVSIPVTAYYVIPVIITPVLCSAAGFAFTQYFSAPAKNDYARSKEWPECKILRAITRSKLFPLITLGLGVYSFSIYGQALIGCAAGTVLARANLGGMVSSLGLARLCTG